VALEDSRFILPITNDPRFEPLYARVAELDGFEGLRLTIFRRRGYPS
ncbi:MAG: hypothetical protein GTN89_05315, partial [Acidobacteria bacterium]|nr:hypothetical protein [Acidobacteriota bacterium]NIM61254.1 hypothetical protein [Acidobacteriota bacterium]NIO58752.1 hypothetical protein [Acidobacteriota bacterium]NIQ29788.1 hypothetical protein [Acidobacteriota bacterium]NIQ84859.1 hypothetical protein [Acidobacteriota bacterium]